MTESAYTRKLLDLVKRGPAPAPLCFKVNDRMRKGWPDAQIIGPGGIVFLEAKVARNPTAGWEKCTPLQQATLQALAGLGTPQVSVCLVTFDGSANCGLLRVDGGRSRPPLRIEECCDRTLAYVASLLRDRVTV